MVLHTGPRYLLLARINKIADLCNTTSVQRRQLDNKIYLMSMRDNGKTILATAISVRGHGIRRQGGQLLVIGDPPLIGRYRNVVAVKTNGFGMKFKRF